MRQTYVETLGLVVECYEIGSMTRKILHRNFRKNTLKKCCLDIRSSTVRSIASCIFFLVFKYILASCVMYCMFVPVTLSVLSGSSFPRLIAERGVAI